MVAVRFFPLVLVAFVSGCLNVAGTPKSEATLAEERVAAEAQAEGAISLVTSDMNTFVSTCLPIISEPQTRDSALVNAGFSKRLAGYAKPVRRGVLLGAGLAVDGDCTIFYPQIWPNKQLATAAIGAVLSQNDYRPTGATNERWTAGNGRIDETLYTNGSQTIAIGMAGGFSSYGLVLSMRLAN